MASAIFSEILKYLINSYPGFDAKDILASLFVQEVISGHEQALVNGKSDPMERGIALFHQIMPMKSQAKHEEFFKVLCVKFESSISFLQQKWDQLLVVHKTGNNPAPSTGNHFLQDSQRSSPPVFRPNPTGAEKVLEMSLEDTTFPHTKDAYEEEIEAIPDLGLLGKKKDKKKLKTNVKHTSVRPCDMNETGNAYYDNFSFPPDAYQNKGIAIVINNINYGGDKDRSGSEIDFTNMCNLLTKLEYQVFEKSDLTAMRMKEEVGRCVGQFNKAYHKSIIVVIMSHGGHGKFEGIDGSWINEEDVLNVVMKNENLAGFPKIFIIQACRGTQTNHGVVSQADGLAQSKQYMKIPVGADTCILHSTTPGYYSWRNQLDGSHFIQAVCQEFSENAHKSWADLLTLGTRIVDRTASDTILTGKLKDVLQLPQVITNMRKKFHFFPGYTGE